MATMIPDWFDEATQSNAERKVFRLLKHAPNSDNWTVLHSLGLTRRQDKPYGEIDFVVMIPQQGVFCLEVKGGDIRCREGEWQTQGREGIATMKRSPFLQAREGMFALRAAILAKAPPSLSTDVVFGYAVVMPDGNFSAGSPEWESWQVIDRDTLAEPISQALQRLAIEQRKLVGVRSAGAEPTVTTVAKFRQILRPDFEGIVTRGTQIADTEERLLRLTEEQFTALDLLSDNDRCLFEGAAGTGKTMLALEYARRSAAGGARTLLVCFNRFLGDWLERRTAEIQIGPNLIAGRWFKILRDLIINSPLAPDFVEQERLGGTSLFEDAYPLFGRMAVEEAALPFDVVVMDEAQDLLKPGIINVLDAWLKNGIKDGRWAVFADFHRQAIFDNSTGEQMRRLLKAASPGFARGTLRQNCRNTVRIGEVTSLLSGFESPPYRLGQVEGVAVDERWFDSPETQCEEFTAALHGLLAGGVKASDIVVLSRTKLENSCISTINGGDDFRIIDAAAITPIRSRVPLIRFATVQAFKGMESPVIIFCDVNEITDAGPQAILYVGMSRARSQLVILLHERNRPLYRQCVIRKLEKEWSKAI